jgi:glycosyltransferase involved in cell wall biosynthesis
MRLISVVLPVYNESESIGPCLRGLAAALASEDHEILVCYDTEEDTTLAAIAAMSDRSAHVRLVRNTLGRGALNAIRTGFQAARGDVVVTSMADLSDPPAVILEMARAIRSGADVVSGSRYMRGGSQQGGPLLKRTLSRIAGVSLHWIAGMGTSDATSNFRGYSRAFLDTVTIESRGGFEIALELTVKAHLAGKVVTETPSSWVDRSAGKSNFRLWRWMPSYLRWYLRATAEPLLVGAVWLAMALFAIAYVAKFGSPDPLGDDLEMAHFYGGQKAPSLAWLWSQHNEHRIPIARLLLLVFMKLTGDVRSGMAFQIAVLAAVSLAAMLAARRVRGRTRIPDAFFPLLLLHTGNSFNLLMGFQLALVLPVALACAIALLLCSGPAILSARRGLWIGICGLALPLNGGAGISQALPIAAWLSAVGVAGWRASKTMLAAGLAACTLLGGYFIGFHFPAGQAHSQDLASMLEVALQTLALALGPAAKTAWPFSGAAVALVALATAALLASTFVRNPAERARAGGLLACIAGSVALALSIGFGRGGLGAGAGFATRYVTLTAPLLATAYFAWLLLGPGSTRRWVPLLLFCLGAAALPSNGSTPTSARDFR